MENFTIKSGEWDLSCYGGRGETYLVQNVAGRERFVARFKYANPLRSARHFAEFLVTLLTPSVYFKEYAEGLPPLTILENRGFVSYNKLMGKFYHFRNDVRLFSETRDIDV